MVIAADVGGMEDARTPFVVDVECIDGVGKTFDKVEDYEAVVDAIAIGRYYGRELEHVVDDDDGVFHGVTANDIQSAEAFFIVASDESNGIVSGYVAATLGCIPFKCGVDINHRVEGVGVVFVVLDFPEVFDSAVVGSGVVFKRNGGMLNGGEYRLPGE